MSVIENPTIDDILASFGMKPNDPPATDPPQADPPATDPPATDPPAGTSDPEPPATEPPATEPEADPDPLKQFNPNAAKDAHAFAELRTQNSKQQAALKGIAEVLGTDPKTLEPDQLVDLVRTLTIKAKANQTGIDASLLTEIEDFRRMQDEQVRSVRYTEATQNVIGLREKYRVPPEELQEFIGKIGETYPQYDPLKDVIDFEAEYLKRYLPKITERQIAAALEAEKTRQATNNQAPGQPPGQGGAASGNQPVNTIKGLEDLLNSLNIS